MRTAGPNEKYPLFMASEKQTFSDEEALHLHQYPQPGKIAVAATKPMATQRDLALAYSPGVAPSHWPG